MAISTASRIAPGMRLRQRYLIREVQRQSPHASTYLALDQERFNRPCILTEFPLQSDNDVTQEMLLARFRQTAVPLFQLNHPQLPQFSAAFRHRQSLFLAQNHAEGVSYRELLNLRHKLNRTLTEPEVLHLLMHLLPVLTELHQRDIIHCKISPDCILLPAKPPKSADELHLLLQHEAPLLVSLGSVERLGQTLATLQDGRNAASVIVGQPGYAPPEQLQTGHLSPSSDLYALAVTSLVMLTGQEPQELLDGQTLNWSWQPFVSLSQPFEAVLRRMLAWQPGDRYASAQAVLEDIHKAFHYINLHSTVPPVSSKAFPISVEQLTVDSLLPKSASRALRTTMTGANLSSAPSSAKKQHGTMQHPAQSAPHKKYPANPNHRAPNIWEVGTVLGLSLGAIAAATTLLGVATVSPLDSLSSDRSNWLQRMAESTVNWSKLNWPEVELSAPDVSGWSAKLPVLRRGKSETAAPQPQTNAGARAGEKLDFGQPMLTAEPDQLSDTSAIREAELQALKTGLDDIDIPIYFEPESNAQTLSGTLYELRNQSYMLVAEPGQELIVQLDAVDAELSVLDARRHPIDMKAELTQSWQGELPGGDRYFIKVMGKGDYRLNVQLWDPNQVIAPVSAEPDAESMDAESRNDSNAEVTGGAEAETLDEAVAPAESLGAALTETSEAYEFEGESFVDDSFVDQPFVSEPFAGDSFVDEPLVREPLVRETDDRAMEE